MTDLTTRRKRASYSMSFKIDLVQQSLLPGASVARLARQHGINDNLLFTWRQRQRYRHLIDIPADHAVGEPVAIDDTLVPVVLKRQLPLLPAASPVPAIPPKPNQVCEVIIGRARLKLSGHLTPAMLATLVRELKKGRR